MLSVFMNRVRRLLLASVGVAVVAAPIALRAQPHSVTPKFEAASIKPCRADAVGARGGGTGAGSSSERLTLNCQTARHLIETAYAPKASTSSAPIEGGPTWLDSDGYTIEAKAEGTPGQAMMTGPMLQTLLEDRFKLKLRRDTREVPVYALIVSKSGPKLQPSTPGSCVPIDYNLPAPHPQFCGTPRRGDPGFHLIGATMADLCWFLSAPEVSDRKTIDKTGISGAFDIQLPGPGELNRAASEGDTSGAPSSNFFEGLRDAVEKLGLNLERAKGPGEFLVVDHIERPSDN